MLKINLFYNQTNRGFTETFYASGDSPPTALDTATRKLVQSSILIRSALTTLQWIRYSVVGSPSKVTSFPLTQIALSNVVSPTELPDVVSTDAIYKITGLNFSRRSLYLRGLYDDSVVRNADTGVPEPSTFLANAVNSYLKKVQDNGWMIRQYKTPVNSTYRFVNVIQIEQSPTNTTEARVTVDQNLTGQQSPLTMVRFAGSKQGKLLPYFPLQAKVSRFSSVAPYTFDIPYQFLGSVPYQPFKLRCIPLDWVYQPITDYVFQSFSSRKTGRPFGSSRGRNPTASVRR